MRIREQLGGGVDASDLGYLPYLGHDCGSQRIRGKGLVGPFQRHRSIPIPPLSPLPMPSSTPPPTFRGLTAPHVVPAPAVRTDATEKTGERWRENEIEDVSLICGGHQILFFIYNELSRHVGPTMTQPPRQTKSGTILPWDLRYTGFAN
jgi:hypothetical protein